MVWNDDSYKTVSGIFNSESNINSLLNTFEQRGLSRDFIDVIMSDKTRDRYGSLARETKMPEGTSVGGISGGVLGAILGGLTMAGSLLIPGVNLLVAGPIVGAIAGGALGTAAGGLVGALVGAGIPEYEAKTYEKHLKTEGNVLVIAHVTDNAVSDTKSVFKQYGALDVDVQNENVATTAGPKTY